MLAGKELCQVAQYLGQSSLYFALAPSHHTWRYPNQWQRLQYLLDNQQKFWATALIEAANIGNRGGRFAAMSRLSRPLRIRLKAARSGRQ